MESAKLKKQQLSKINVTKKNINSEANLNKNGIPKPVRKKQKINLNYQKNDLSQKDVFRQKNVDNQKSKNYDASFNEVVIKFKKLFDQKIKLIRQDNPTTQRIDIRSKKQTPNDISNNSQNKVKKNSSSNNLKKKDVPKQAFSEIIKDFEAKLNKHSKIKQKLDKNQQKIQSLENSLSPSTLLLEYIQKNKNKNRKDNEKSKQKFYNSKSNEKISKNKNLSKKKYQKLTFFQSTQSNNLKQKTENQQIIYSKQKSKSKPGRVVSSKSKKKRAHQSINEKVKGNLTLREKQKGSKNEYNQTKNYSLGKYKNRLKTFQSDYNEQIQNQKQNNKNRKNSKKAIKEKQTKRNISKMSQEFKIKKKQGITEYIQKSKQQNQKKRPKSPISFGIPKSHRQQYKQFLNNKPNPFTILPNKNENRKKILEKQVSKQKQQQKRVNKEDLFQYQNRQNRIVSSSSDRQDESEQQEQSFQQQIALKKIDRNQDKQSNFSSSIQQRSDGYLVQNQQLMVITNRQRVISKQRPPQRKLRNVQGSVITYDLINQKPFQLGDANKFTYTQSQQQDQQKNQLEFESFQETQRSNSKLGIQKNKNQHLQQSLKYAEMSNIFCIVHYLMGFKQYLIYSNKKDLIEQFQNGIEQDNIIQERNIIINKVDHSQLDKKSQQRKINEKVKEQTQKTIQKMKQAQLQQQKKYIQIQHAFKQQQTKWLNFIASLQRIKNKKFDNISQQLDKMIIEAQYNHLALKSMQIKDNAYIYKHQSRRVDNNKINEKNDISNHNNNDRNVQHIRNIMGNGQKSQQFKQNNINKKFQKIQSIQNVIDSSSNNNILSQINEFFNNDHHNPNQMNTNQAKDAYRNKSKLQAIDVQQQGSDNIIKKVVQNQKSVNKNLQDKTLDPKKQAKNNTNTHIEKDSNNIANRVMIKISQGISYEQEQFKDRDRNRKSSKSSYESNLSSISKSIAIYSQAAPSSNIIIKKSTQTNDICIQKFTNRKQQPIITIQKNNNNDYQLFNKKDDSQLEAEYKKLKARIRVQGLENKQSPINQVLNLVFDNSNQQQINEHLHHVSQFTQDNRNLDRDLKQFKSRLQKIQNDNAKQKQEVQKNNDYTLTNKSNEDNKKQDKNIQDAQIKKADLIKKQKNQQDMKMNKQRNQQNAQQNQQQRREVKKMKLSYQEAPLQIKKILKKQPLMNARSSSELQIQSRQRSEKMLMSQLQLNQFISSRSNRSNKSSKSKKSRDEAEQRRDRNETNSNKQTGQIQRYAQLQRNKSQSRKIKILQQIKSPTNLNMGNKLHSMQQLNNRNLMHNYNSNDTYGRSNGSNANGISGDVSYEAGFSHVCSNSNNSNCNSSSFRDREDGWAEGNSGRYRHINMEAIDNNIHELVNNNDNTRNPNRNKIKISLFNKKKDTEQLQDNKMYSSEANLHQQPQSSQKSRFQIRRDEENEYSSSSFTNAGAHNSKKESNIVIHRNKHSNKDFIVFKAKNNNSNSNSKKSVSNSNLSNHSNININNINISNYDNNHDQSMREVQQLKVQQKAPIIYQQQQYLIVHQQIPSTDPQIESPPLTPTLDTTNRNQSKQIIQPYQQGWMEKEVIMAEQHVLIHRVQDQQQEQESQDGQFDYPWSKSGSKLRQLQVIENQQDLSHPGPVTSPCAIFMRTKKEHVIQYNVTNLMPTPIDIANAVERLKIMAGGAIKNQLQAQDQNKHNISKQLETNKALETKKSRERVEYSDEEQNIEGKIFQLKKSKNINGNIYQCPEEVLQFLFAQFVFQMLEKQKNKLNESGGEEEQLQFQLNRIGQNLLKYCMSHNIQINQQQQSDLIEQLEKQLQLQSHSNKRTDNITRRQNITNTDQGQNIQNIRIQIEKPVKDKMVLFQYNLANQQTKRDSQKSIQSEISGKEEERNILNIKIVQNKANNNIIQINQEGIQYARDNNHRNQYQIEENISRENQTNILQYNSQQYESSIYLKKDSKYIIDITLQLLQFIHNDEARYRDFMSRLKKPLGIDTLQLLRILRDSDADQNIVNIRQNNQQNDEQTQEQSQEDHNFQNQNDFNMGQQDLDSYYVISLETFVLFQENNTLGQSTTYQQFFNQAIYDKINMLLDTIKPYGSKGLPAMNFMHQYKQKNPETNKLVYSKQFQKQNPSKFAKIQSYEHIRYAVLETLIQDLKIKLGSMTYGVDSEKVRDYSLRKMVDQYMAELEEQWRTYNQGEFQVKHTILFQIQVSINMVAVQKQRKGLKFLSTESQLDSSFKGQLRQST